MEPDFSGYATKAGLKCSDGRTIMPDAFKHQDNVKVPLVWQHGHGDAENVLGHAILEAREDGMYAKAFFNSTAKGQSAKTLVQHGDVDSLSIYANELIEKVINGSKQVFHGAIREVSLVLSGANPGAKIDFVAIQHGDGDVETLDDEAVIYTGLSIEHADGDDDDDSDDSNDDSDDDSVDEDDVQDVYESLTDKQKEVVHYMIGAALEGTDDDDAEHSSDTDEESLNHQEGTEDMTRNNIFEQQGGSATIGGTTLTHDQMTTLAHSVFEDCQKGGSFREAFVQHAQEYGITNIEVLFPDAKNVSNTPEWLTRKMEWVDGILNGARKLPYARIKSQSADLTHEEARAKGYVKGDLKKEQYFAIAGRETTPKTIYKKQKLDRDDIIDITDFDVVNWIWQEMRFMLREEIARAILVSDGREVDDPDKIDENKIRPIATDDDFYTHRVDVPANTTGESLIEAILRSRKNYKGAGNPTFYTTEDTVTDLLLLKDKMGRRLYPTETELKSALRVSDIVAVDVLEGVTDSEGGELVGVMVNISDYSIGTDKGGEITTFDDFDIDYNQYKYLIEGRMSGALTQHKRAIAIWRGAGTQATPAAPTFNSATNTITIPSATGVTYQVDGVEEAAGSVVITEDAVVTATADEGYYFLPGTTTSWNFQFNAEA